ncbi:MAG TPA: SHOCT domain-containing protein [Magnetovibrio sp.]
MKSKSTLLAGLTIGITALATGAMAQVGEGYGVHPHMWGHGGSWSYGGHIFFPIVGIIVVVLVIFLVMRMAGCSRHRCGGYDRVGRGDVRGGSNAMAILEERFAKGEIDKADFEERKKALRD